MECADALINEISGLDAGMPIDGLKKIFLMQR